jgi:hypothetical protein
MLMSLYLVDYETANGTDEFSSGYSMWLLDTTSGIHSSMVFLLVSCEHVKFIEFHCKRQSLINFNKLPLAVTEAKLTLIFFFNIKFVH